jgi:hypothetical protein
MSPKEKSKELYDKYFELVEAQTSEQQEDNARKAALIAVDEIIQSHYVVMVGVTKSIEDYWQEVKQEIEKL